jgi:DNA-binding MarR family transcriptional regulator
VEEFLQEQLAEPYLIPLLFRGFRNLQGMVQPALESRGHRGIGLSETRLLLCIESEGTRINLLAERTGTSRQFTSRIVHDLELRGYISTRSDRDDLRATVVVLEPLGHKLFGDLREVKIGVDATLARRIGVERMALFMETLRDLIRETENPTP